MSNLRALFPDTNFSVTTGGNTPAMLYVYNTNIQTANNGGRCCLWTVPSGSVWAKFEVYGGGGDGAGGCCCMQGGLPGGSGSYARKTIRVNPGESYTICAAGTGCCAQSCIGTQGFPSYACNASATYPLCLCASGGMRGDNRCFAGTSGCYSCSTQICGSACGYDFAICGTSGASYDGVYCGFDGWQYNPTGVYDMAMGQRISYDVCLICFGCGIAGAANFPGYGAGGGNAHVHGGPCCWGGFGSGGMVVVTYK